jgi:pimeloyl-ACP methyl ester carboxylesterase
VGSLLLAALLLFTSPSQAAEKHDPARALGPGFRSETISVNGTRIHYVRGGTGPAVILIHGFPQDWFEYHEIMPRLSKQFTVIAVDLRGVGDSAATADGYDAANLAEDVHQLVRALKLERVYVVGHDIGGMVAYAFARLFPEAARGAMILDVPLPAIDGWEEIQGHPAMWHVRFMQVPGLAEKLVEGRQVDYFSYFFSFGKFSAEDMAHFTKAYAVRAQLRAVFEMYRSFPKTARFNAAQRARCEVPLLLADGDNSPFAPLLPKEAADLRAKGCENVATELIPGSVHYVVGDQPNVVAALIERHASPGLHSQ